MFSVFNRTSFLIWPLLIVLSALNSSPAAPAAGEPVTLDDFHDTSVWKAEGSDGIRTWPAGVPGIDGDHSALQLNYDFSNVAGYALVRRSLPLDLSGNFALSFYIRSDAGDKAFEVKLVDDSGENVWWYQRREMHFTGQWQLVTIKKRQIEFAWGPIADKRLVHGSQIQFVINKSKAGGPGKIEISQLGMITLPAEGTPDLAPRITASSSLPGHGPAMVLALAHDPSRSWKSDPKTGRRQQLTLDFGRPREFGALVLHWANRAWASRYDIDLSDDSSAWHTVRKISAGFGDVSALLLTETQTRFVRLVLYDGPKADYQLAGLEIKPLEYGENANQFLLEQARTAPRGTYPRGFSGQQNYWTIVGVDGGHQTGLIGEDGAVELHPGGAAVEPFVVIDGKVVSWADVETRQSLREGYLPIPSVTWKHAQFQLKVTAFATGQSGNATLLSRYEIENSSNRTQTMQLVLAVRPLQVNPPSQFLNIAGGVSPISELGWQNKVLRINGQPAIHALTQPQPDQVRLARFESGFTVPAILANPLTTAAQLHDESALASGLLIYKLKLAPHARRVIALSMPLEGDVRPEPDQKNVTGWLTDQESEVANFWRSKLNKVTISVPEQGNKLVDTMRSALAQILMMRDGAALQPGTRSYARSWIRDGAMMSDSLLRLGATDVARDYLRWYAGFQFDNGKTPCCVDQRGADPVPENDSHGEFLFLVAQVFRHTHDTALLMEMWPHVVAAVNYMETLRQSGRSSANLDSGLGFYGLMPASISHEGYSARPMHSYWDDFWALRGYKDAVYLAGAAGQSDQMRLWSAYRDEFQHDLYASLDSVMHTQHLNFIPGCAELGDFDPTSTTVALAPGGEQANLPAAQLNGGFERYWHEFQQRAALAAPTEIYTPYEIRTVSAFIRLGWRDFAQQLLAYFFADQRPYAWNQWAEVVSRDARKTIFVGDMPHGWIASDYLRSTLDMFAYERESDHSLVLAAGIPADWMASANGVAINGLNTPFGMLSYTLKTDSKSTLLTIPAGLTMPAGGLVFIAPAPLLANGVAVTVNHARVNVERGEIRITRLPAEVEIRNQAVRTPSIQF